MARTAAAALAATLLLPAAAPAGDASPTLDEVMQGATAMATIADAYLFVARPDGGWVCALNISSNHFAALVDGDVVVVEKTVPGAVCIPATNVQNLME